jgi:hypothetical protein
LNQLVFRADSNLSPNREEEFEPIILGCLSYLGDKAQFPNITPGGTIENWIRALDSGV